MPRKKKGPNGRPPPPPRRRGPRKATLQDLPPETLLYIFSFLDPVNLCSCMLVAMEWCIFASDDSVWLALFKRLFPKGSSISLPLTLNLYLMLEEPPSKEQGDYIQACKKIYLNPIVLERQQAWPATNPFLNFFAPGPFFISLGGKVVLHNQYVPPVFLEYLKMLVRELNLILRSNWRQLARRIDDPMFIWGGYDHFFLQSYQLGAAIVRCYLGYSTIASYTDFSLGVTKYLPILPLALGSGVQFYFDPDGEHIWLFGGDQPNHPLVAFIIPIEPFLKSWRKLVKVAQKNCWGKEAICCRRHRTKNCPVCEVMGDHFDQEDRVGEWSRERREQVGRSDKRVRKLKFQMKWSIAGQAIPKAKKNKEV